eukprot:scaffold454049_cov35-Prasinocladus_malaysianus.AAC.2
MSIVLPWSIVSYSPDHRHLLYVTEISRESRISFRDQESLRIRSATHKEPTAGRMERPIKR